MNRPEDQVLVIFGASGDLTKRMLMPSLYELHVRQMLPEHFIILGTSRTPMSDDEFRLSICVMLQELKGEDNLKGDEVDRFMQNVYYQPFDPENGADELGERVMLLMEENAIPMKVVYYLATPPTSQQAITKYLGRSCLFQVKEKGGWHRIVVEKPFGINLATARNLNESLLEVFCESEIYRIDHFLGKETVQNILVLRFANQIFESLWNRNYIDYVEIYALESLGIEKRGKYYETAGALRDMVQNHLMQLLAFVAMEAPATIEPEVIRDETAKVLRSLRLWTGEDIARNVIRAQYEGGEVKGQAVPGYLEEKDVAPNSDRETYVALKVFIDNWRWSNVPFYIYTGKRLKDKRSGVVIHFKSTPHKLFEGQCQGTSCNQLIIRMTPDEGVMLKFGLKMPGGGFKVQQVGMDFLYASLCNNYLPGAYERLLLDAMQGDSMLYTRNDALEASWRFIDPIVNYWREHPGDHLLRYTAGSEGPDLTGRWDVLPPVSSEEKNVCWL
ncbi:MULTISPECIES: glucose-6-phosphate dehydrogenase [Butyricimonas]|uniref:glucose-6-phosphate dehydrogenase n=1 Tax=Butyricimonas TaxID=574697 RepID=UPI000364C79B|nr:MULTISPECIES: glucose-6-phosphate dehydrogenase [Butyricimonas]